MIRKDKFIWLIVSVFRVHDLGYSICDLKSLNIGIFFDENKFKNL